MDGKNTAEIIKYIVFGIIAAVGVPYCLTVFVVMNSRIAASPDTVFTPFAMNVLAPLLWLTPLYLIAVVIIVARKILNLKSNSTHTPVEDKAQKRAGRLLVIMLMLLFIVFAMFRMS